MLDANRKSLDFNVYESPQIIKEHFQINSFYLLVDYGLKFQVFEEF
jgi:hypothetical protein